MRWIHTTKKKINGKVHTYVGLKGKQLLQELEWTAIREFVVVYNEDSIAYNH